MPHPRNPAHRVVPMHVSWQQVTARRIARHFLDDAPTDIPGAVGAMCGAHAQVMSAAEVSIGVRVAAARPVMPWPTARLTRPTCVRSSPLVAASVSRSASRSLR